MSDSEERATNSNNGTTAVDVKTVKVETEGGQGGHAGQALSGQPIITMAMFNHEPPTFISETKSYAAYKTDLKIWSRITGVPKKNQAEVVVYGLEGHPTGIKEKILLKLEMK